MASFKKYIKKKFYNQLYEASSRFVVANKKDLGFYLGWVEAVSYTHLTLPTNSRV